MTQVLEKGTQLGVGKEAGNGHNGHNGNSAEDLRGLRVEHQFTDDPMTRMRTFLENPFYPRTLSTDYFEATNVKAELPNGDTLQLWTYNGPYKGYESFGFISKADAQNEAVNLQLRQFCLSLQAVESLRYAEAGAAKRSIDEPNSLEEIKTAYKIFRACLAFNIGREFIARILGKFGNSQGSLAQLGPYFEQVRKFEELQRYSKEETKTETPKEVVLEQDVPVLINA